MIFNESNLLVVQITTECNYNCSYCEFKNQLTNTTFTIKKNVNDNIKYLNIIHQISLINKSPFKTILITGGEPSIDFYFLKIL